MERNQRDGHGAAQSEANLYAILKRTLL